MKYFLLTSLFAITSIATGQELATSETDDFTGSENRMTKYYEIGMAEISSVTKYKLACATLRVDDAYGLGLWSTADQGCAGAMGNYVIFLFEDGSTLKLDDDIVDVDCEERAVSRYIISPSDLAGKTLKRIRFAQSEGYVDYDVMGEFTLNELFEAVKD